MADEQPQDWVELRLGMPESARMKLEVLKNKLDAPNLGHVILQALSAFDYIISNEKAGGRLIMEDVNGKATVLTMHKKKIITPGSGG